MEAVLSSLFTVVGMLATSWLTLRAANQRSDSELNHQAQSALEERTRDRLERLYLAALKLRRDVNTQLANAIFMLTRNVAPKPRSGREVPPLFELEMLVELYFRESLSETFKATREAAERHVDAYIEAIRVAQSSDNPDERAISKAEVREKAGRAITQIDQFARQVKADVPL
ncbi:hypothetical protein SSPSH_003267 [Salinisphaera shabanensis E1L3A]|uniref:Uncharacterized protein n=1 Tax=Salinisphaera shabanensis E1L3A TaxID=1033802 RepID=F7Q2X0_9GAMM|nr:hypothetical protein [Salinisphaera shabanensis]ERJ17905.1 hypothetical protein SSPSH_003267 [Salinisphaera shabanensis E1L3A]